MGDGLIHGEIFLQEDKLGVHGPGRGIRVKIEQIAQFLGAFLGQLFQEHVAVLLVQLVQYVGRVIRSHLRNDLGGHVRVEIFQDIHGHIAVQLARASGRVFLGHVAQGANLLFQAQIFEVIGHVRGMNEFRPHPVIQTSLGHADAAALPAAGRSDALSQGQGATRRRGRARRLRRLCRPDFISAIVSHASCSLPKSEVIVKKTAA